MIDSIALTAASVRNTAGFSSPKKVLQSLHSMTTLLVEIVSNTTDINELSHDSPHGMMANDIARQLSMIQRAVPAAIERAMHSPELLEKLFSVHDVSQSILNAYKRTEDVNITNIDAAMTVLAESKAIMNSAVQTLPVLLPVYSSTPTPSSIQHVNYFNQIQMDLMSQQRNNQCPGSPAVELQCSNPLSPSPPHSLSPALSVGNSRPASPSLNSYSIPVHLVPVRLPVSSPSQHQHPYSYSYSYRSSSPSAVSPTVTDRLSLNVTHHGNHSGSGFSHSGYDGREYRSPYPNNGSGSESILHSPGHVSPSQHSRYQNMSSQRLAVHVSPNTSRSSSASRPQSQLRNQSPSNTYSQIPPPHSQRHTMRSSVTSSRPPLPVNNQNHNHPHNIHMHMHIAEHKDKDDLHDAAFKMSISKSDSLSNDPIIITTADDPFTPEALDALFERSISIGDTVLENREKGMEQDKKVEKKRETREVIEDEKEDDLSSAHVPVQLSPGMPGFSHPPRHPYPPSPNAIQGYSMNLQSHQQVYSYPYGHLPTHPMATIYHPHFPQYHQQQQARHSRQFSNPYPMYPSNFSRIQDPSR